MKKNLLLTILMLLGLSSAKAEIVPSNSGTEIEFVSIHGYYLPVAGQESQNYLNLNVSSAANYYIALDGEAPCWYDDDAQKNSSPEPSFKALTTQ